MPSKAQRFAAVATASALAGILLLWLIPGNDTASKDSPAPAETTDSSTSVWTENPGTLITLHTPAATKEGTEVAARPAELTHPGSEPARLRLSRRERLTPLEKTCRTRSNTPEPTCAIGLGPAWWHDGWRCINKACAEKAVWKMRRVRKQARETECDSLGNYIPTCENLYLFSIRGELYCGKIIGEQC